MSVSFYIVFATITGAAIRSWLMTFTSVYGINNKNWYKTNEESI